MIPTGYIAFDLDGTLVDADELHYVALNAALATCGDQAPITREEHLKTFKGLPTRKKLDMLISMGRVPEYDRVRVTNLKQVETIRAIQSTLKPDESKMDLLDYLRKTGWRICVCSNAVRDSVHAMLKTCDLLKFLDFFLSNQDAAPKPAPHMYLLAAHMYGISPEVLIAVEDAAPGKQSVRAAGCRLVEIFGPDEVNMNLLPAICQAREELARVF